MSCSSPTICRGSKAGQFVVGTRGDRLPHPDHVAPRPVRVAQLDQPCAVLVRSTIESELSDGEDLLARGKSVLVGFDLAAQRSRTFSPEEIAVFEGLKAQAS